MAQGGQCVFIAEDHPVYLGGLVEFLQEIGCPVAGAAQTALETLQFLQDRPVSLLIIDFPLLKG